MNQRPIVIDGKTYNSVNEMPPDVRARYEQAMNSYKNEDPGSAPEAFNIPEAGQAVSNMMKFIVDGKEYNGIEDLPPEARARYEQAMGALDKNQNGMPDFLEGMMGMVAQTPAQQSAPATTSPRPAPRQPMPASPIISPDTSSGWTLVLVGGLLLFACALGATGIWYFFLR